MADKGLIEIRFNEEVVQGVKHKFFGVSRSLPRILSRAINRTTKEGKTNIARWVSSSTGLEGFDPDRGIKLTKATLSHWESQLRISKARIPLIHFGAKETETGVYYTIDKKSGRKIIRSAFIDTMPDGHRGVFKRRGRDQLPIRELFGPSLGVLIKDAPQVADEILEKNLDVQVGLVLAKGRAG